MNCRYIVAFGQEQPQAGDNARIRATMPLLSAFLLFIFSVPTIAAPANAQGTPFYQGKTIRIIVGSTTGSLYDQWAQLLAQAMQKHVPGRPNMIVQNMPGASGVVAANYGYTVAAPDGLTLVMFQRHIYIEQLVERKEVKFDMRRFHWIGSPDKSLPMFYIRTDSPYKSMDDILKAAEPPKCGATGTSDLTYSMSKVLEVALGARMNLVVGYSGGSKIDAAMERGEVVCRVISLDVHLGREPFQTWDKKGFDRHLLLFGRNRDPRIPKVPTIYEFMERRKTPELSRRVAELILVGNRLGRPMVAPPGTPPEAVRILIDAYGKVFSDPDLVTEVKRSRIYMEPSSGAKLQHLVQQVMDQPPGVIARLKTLLAD
jgi:tripartite-type tricarboxylate transporter receptor subunit TctC